MERAPIVLQLTIEYLCLHCHPPPGCNVDVPYNDPNDTQPDAGFSSCSALASICLTSKLFNRLATPYLYHRPTYHDWWLLVRSLIKRLELRPYVKHLRGRWYETGGLEIWDLPGKIQVKLEGPDDDSKATRTVYIPVNISDPNSVDVDIYYLTALCPNLEVADFHCASEFGHAFSECPPRSLLSLKKLEIVHKVQRIRRQLSALDLIFIGNLSAAALNLTHLVLYGVVSSKCPEVAFDNLRVLRFRDSILSDSVLRRFPRGTRNLQNFSFEAASLCEEDWQFMPSQAERTLRDFAGNLKSLVMVVITSEFSRVESHIESDEYHFSSFADFTQLEHLTVDLSSLAICQYIDGELPKTFAGIFLVDVLPRTIRSLTLETWCWTEEESWRRDGSQDDLLMILESLTVESVDKLPSLKRVTLRDRNPLAGGNREIEIWSASQEI